MPGHPGKPRPARAIQWRAVSSFWTRQAAMNRQCDAGSLHAPTMRAIAEQSVAGSDVAMNQLMLRTDALAKSFTLHLQGGVRIPVLSGIGLELHAGECVVLSGPSGVGKSTLMRSLYGNYRAEQRPHPDPPSRRDGRSRHRRPAHHSGHPPRDTRLCQPVPPRGATRAGARCRRRGADRPRFAAGRGAPHRHRSAAAAEHSAPAARACRRPPSPAASSSG